MVRQDLSGSLRLQKQKRRKSFTYRHETARYVKNRETVPFTCCNLSVFGEGSSCGPSQERQTPRQRKMYFRREHTFSQQKFAKRKKVAKYHQFLEDSFSAVSKPILGSEYCILFCIFPPVVCHLNQLIQLFLPWKELLFHECLQQSCERLLLFSKLCKS